MSELALLGPYNRAGAQRMIHDNGVDMLLQEQRVGEVPVLFPEQWAFVQRRGGGPYPPWEPGLPPGPRPFSFLLLLGRLVDDTFTRVRYVERGDHGKPTETTYQQQESQFFLVERAIDLTEQADAARAAGLPLGQPFPAAQVPASLLP